MALPSCTPVELKQLIDASGFPFELEVAHLLDARGYTVELSRQFFDPLDEHEAEIDIVATRTFAYDTNYAGRVQAHLQLAIECKDNSLPYVLFGFPHAIRRDPKVVDRDAFYCQVRTTEDDAPFKHAIFALGNDPADPTSNDIKAIHHQLNTPIRHHQAAAVEPHNGKLKFNVSERLRNAINGLGGFAQSVKNMSSDMRLLLRDISHDPAVWIFFSVLVHRGQHYRYSASHSLEAAEHTTLFTSINSGKGSLAYTVDFVSFTGLSAALNTIESTFHSMERQVLRYLGPSPRPLHSGS